MYNSCPGNNYNFGVDFEKYEGCLLRCSPEDHATCFSMHYAKDILECINKFSKQHNRIKTKTFVDSAFAFMQGMIMAAKSKR